MAGNSALEPRSFSRRGERGQSYSAARAQQLALHGGEPGYGYGEDYKRDRRREAEAPAASPGEPII